MGFLKNPSCSRQATITSCSTRSTNTVVPAKRSWRSSMPRQSPPSRLPLRVLPRPFDNRISKVFFHRLEHEIWLEEAADCYGEYPTDHSDDTEGEREQYEREEFIKTCPETEKEERHRKKESVHCPDLHDRISRQLR